MNESAVEALLLERGCTLTPQRRAILRYLDGNLQHPTAAEVFAAVTRDFPMASRATVYNTLALLAEVGAVRELHDAERDTRYDPNVTHHHHLVCPTCGRMDDVAAAHVHVMFDGEPVMAHVRIERPCGRCGGVQG